MSGLSRTSSLLLPEYMEAYVEVTIQILDEKKDVVTAALEQIGFEGFWDKGLELVAYIAKDEFDHKKLYDTLSEFKMENSFKHGELAAQNWNATWEENYHPILIYNRLVIRSPFHEKHDGIPLEVVIQPRMSFGTGHHETTRLMAEMMLTMDFHDKSALDMGTGTGVLAFLAEKLGASDVVGIDNDLNSVENANDNMAYNEDSKAMFLHGSAEAIPSRKFNIVLSNITKNINVSLLPSLVNSVSNDGHLVLAGFLNFDLKEIDDLITGYSFELIRNSSIGEWECLLYQKRN